MKRTLRLAALCLSAYVAFCACGAPKSAVNSASKVETAAVSDGASVSDGADMKVISYNIRLGVAKDGDNSWAYRRPATIAMLQEQMPDVFGVQEAYPFQLEYIHKYMPMYEYVGVGREDGVHGGEHMAVFYNTEKVELLDWGTYWLSETPDVAGSMGWDAHCPRTATWTKCRHKATGRSFFFVDTHLDHRGVVARKKGLALIVNEIAKMNPENAPMVLVGDFNIRPDSDNLVELNKVMKSARNVARKTVADGSFNGWGEYAKSAGAPSWQGEAPAKGVAPIIDYIYISGFASCLEFKVLNETYVGVPYISDHYPIMTTLKF